MSFPILFPLPENPPRQQPNGIEGLACWYRSDDKLTGATDVITWYDRSGNGHDLTDPTIGRRPHHIDSDPLFAGHPAIDADGVNDYLLSDTVTEINGVTEITTFSVQYAPTTATAPTLDIVWNFCTTSGPTLTSLNANTYFNSLGVHYNIGSVPTPGLLSLVRLTSPPDLTVPFIATTIWNRAGTTQATRYSPFINGSPRAITSMTDSQFTPANFTSSNLMVFGRSSSATTAGRCIMAELIIYNRRLSDSERRSVENYLGARYGIAVTS